MFIDLDNFKIVNDTIGHDVGDMVLIETAKRVESSIRDNDFVARLGGDEFVVLIDTSQKNRDLVINNISAIAQKILKSLETPYLIENYDFRITASIGIKYGFSSILFSVVTTYSVIIIHDTLRLKGEKGRQADLLNKILTNVEQYSKLNESLSIKVLHYRPLDVLSGAVVGIVATIVLL